MFIEDLPGEEEKKKHHHKTPQHPKTSHHLHLSPLFSPSTLEALKALWPLPISSKPQLLVDGGRILVAATRRRVGRGLVLLVVLGGLGAVVLELGGHALGLAVILLLGTKTAVL